MKLINLSAAFAFVVLATLMQTTPARAQATAFTYQGKLNDGTNPANGTYDFQFAIYDAATNGNQIGDALTNTATVVTNGLFTVILDFNGAPFDGHPRWLEIGVQTNGGDGFRTLTPRQPILPVPYAIAANSAVFVAATNINGAISDAQLSTNVALTSGSATFSGAITATNFNGNGAGLTNVPGTLLWQVVSGTNQPAASNTGYLATNDAQVVITLPVSANLGDVIGISSAGAGGWKIAQNTNQVIKSPGGFLGYTIWTNHLPKTSIPYSVASSTDGMKLVVGTSSYIYNSTDAGISWTFTNYIAGYYYVASSADGTKLFATGPGRRVFSSTNSGLTWNQQNAPPYDGRGIACSADGNKVAVISPPFLYFSPDAGVDWISRNSPLYSSIAMSADGTKLAGSIGNVIYTSTNSGATWVRRTNFNSGTIYAIASSADGSKLAAATRGPIYTSIDSGATWTAQNSSTQNWNAIAMSPDGTKLIAGTGFGNSFGLLYTSTDSGMTWIPQNNGSGNWSSVAISADGTRLAAVAQGGRIPGVYISQAIKPTKTTPGAAGYLIGGQNTAVELQYVGNGQFILLNHEGNLFAF